MPDIFVGAMVWALVTVFGSVSLACLVIRFPAVMAYAGAG